MNLVIDAGNTSIKLGVFIRGKLEHTQTTDREGFAGAIRDTFSNFPGISHAILASVGSLGTMARDVVSVFCEVHVVSALTQVPYKNAYASPQTLGADRMALATAAYYYKEKENVLVIDAGSCITYDMVNDIGEYMGGAISPGLRMRYRALNTFTAKLPELKPEAPMTLIGNATESSIHSGVVNGLCFELDGTIDQYRSHFENLTVILTGGDSQFLSNRLKNTIFALPNFLLQGLNQLLDYNKS